MQAAYSRNLSGMENLYRTFECDNPFYIQWVIDFSALPENIDWRSVIAESVSSNPSAAVALSNSYFFKKWKSGGTIPRFCEEKFDGILEDALLKLPASLSESGPVCEIRKITYSSGTALVFRSLHSVMDASGLWGWLSDCIRIVNGLSPIGNRSAINDKEFSRRLGVKPGKASMSAKLYRPLTSGNADNVKSFFSFSIPGNAKGMSKRICHLLKQFAKKKNIDELCLLIPSDLRKYDKTVHTNANLTGILDIRFNANTPDNEIDRGISEKIRARSDVKYVLRMDAWKFLPIRIWKKLLKGYIANQNYPGTGVISNVGNLNPTDVTIKGVCPRNVMCIAPYSGLHPIFVVSSSFNNQLTVTFAIPKHLQGDAQQLVDFIKSELQK